jgi:hypothetical protein
MYHTALHNQYDSGRLFTFPNHSRPVSWFDSGIGDPRPVAWFDSGIDNPCILANHSLAHLFP